MNTRIVRHILFAFCAGLLVYSFIGRASWRDLCAGLAFFLFGMQCMKEGLQRLAGSKLEQLLTHSTATSVKGLIFGVFSTMILQSTTVVALLTIAFISTGLITLAGGITIILGANLGASSGVWLLALAGQNISLAPFAYPMIVLGVLASFNGHRSQAIGRVLLGIAFILLAIELIKGGFYEFTTDFDFKAYTLPGITGVLLFTVVGMVITVILQSSHATIMLVLTALGAAQISIEQSFAIAIGANIGSAVTTGLMGFLGGDKSGQRLALAHVLFNVVTALLTLVLLKPLTQIILGLTQKFEVNALIQLALFHTLFNVMGVVVFWCIKERLCLALCRWIRDVDMPTTILMTATDSRTTVPSPQPIGALYLTEQALASNKTALQAIIQELEHLKTTSIEVICHALFLPIEQLSRAKMDSELLNQAPQQLSMDADTLYQQHIKGIYSDLIQFMGHIEFTEENAALQQLLLGCQVVALHMVDSVKDAKHLQKNLRVQLYGPDSSARQHYVLLRRFVLTNLREVDAIGMFKQRKDQALERLAQLEVERNAFVAQFRSQLFIGVRKELLSSFHTSSLMNDLNYANRIIASLSEMLFLAYDHTYDFLENEQAPMI